MLPYPPWPKPASWLRSLAPLSPKREPPPKLPRSNPPPPWKPPKPPPPWKPNATTRSAPIPRHAAIAVPANSAPASLLPSKSFLIIDVLLVLLGGRDRRERDFLRTLR